MHTGHDDDNDDDDAEVRKVTKFGISINHITDLFSHLVNRECPWADIGSINLRQRC